MKEASQKIYQVITALEPITDETWIHLRHHLN